MRFISTKFSYTFDIKIINLIVIAILFTQCSLFKKQHQSSTQNSNNTTNATDSLKKITNQYKNYTSLDLRPFQSSVKDQGTRNTCGYFAVCAMLESYLKLNHIYTNLSEEYLCAMYQKNKYGVHEFSSIVDICDLIQDSGLLTESDWPYQHNWRDLGFPYYQFQNPDTVPNNKQESNFPPANIINKRFFLTNITNFRAYKKSQKIISKLSKDSIPLIATIPMPIDEYYYYDSNNQFLKKSTESRNNFNYKTGEINTNRSKKYKVIGNHTEFIGYVDEETQNHFVLIVGFDLDKQIFLVKNSWGEYFGKNGYGFIKFIELDSSEHYLISFNKPKHFNNISIYDTTEIKKPIITNFNASINSLISRSMEIKITGEINRNCRQSIVVHAQLGIENDSCLKQWNCYPYWFKFPSHIQSSTKDQYIQTAWHTNKNDLRNTINFADSEPLVLRFNPELILEFNIPNWISTSLVWLMALVLALNTLGNLKSKNKLEKKIFTPLTILLFILTLLLALD